MGEGNSKKARIYVKIATTFMFAIDVIVAILIIIWRDSIAHLFTGNQKVIDHLNSTFNIMAVLIILYGVHLVEAGALRGLGM